MRSMPSLRQILLSVFALSAWLLAPRPASAQEGVLRFEHLTVEDGLSHSTVRASVQDRFGFLWFATQDGLSRYDGYGFKVYRHDPADPGSLPENEVYALLVDRGGRLWAGTFGGGLARFLAGEERFERRRHDPADAASLSHDAVISLLEDRAGSLWIGTADGLNRLVDGRSFRYPRPSGAGAGESRFYVAALAEDRSGRLWIGSSAGLYRLPGSSAHGVAERLELYRHPAAGATGSPWSVTALLEDRRGRLWIGCEDGLRRLDPEAGTLVHYRHDPSDPRSLAEDHVQSLFETPAGELWIGTLSQGLDRLAASGAGRFTHARHDPFDPESLSDNSVLSIYQDATGILWLGGYGGVDKYDPRRDRFVTYRQRPGRKETLSGPSVWALYEDAAGVLWVGTYDTGLDRIDRAQGTVEHDPPDPEDPGALPQGTVSAIHEDRAGTMWIGTWGGLCRFDRERERFATYRHDPSDPASLTEDTVYAIHEDRSGRLWVGTYGGLDRLERGPQERFVHYPTAPGEPALLGETPIYDILEDSDDGLWFASDRDGLFRLQSGVFSHFRHDPADDDSLSSDKLADLFEDRAGNLWVGTYGAGLNRAEPDRRRFRRYRRADGLPSDTVLGILEDGDGRLWLATTDGLSRFDPATGTFRNYDASDGLQGNVFSSRSAFRGASGEMFFGGIRGLTAFFPDRIVDDPHPPPVVITDFLLFHRPAAPRAVDPRSPLERSILATSELTLTHRDYVFALEFAALHFASPEKNRYAYRLEGFDRDWVEVDAGRRLAWYSNLAPGEYTFRVRASNGDGVWNEDGAALGIAVLPPPWRTWWAYALYLLALSAAVAAYRRSHRLKLERERASAERERRASQQLRAADRRKGELIEELEAKNAELERFTYTVSHDLKSPLLTIKGFLGLVRKDAAAGDAARLEHDLERLGAAADKMTELLDDLLRLSRVGRQIATVQTVAISELAREAAGLLAAEIAERGAEVEIEPDMPPVVGDRGRLVQVFQNLIHNAVKYMGAQPAPRITVGVRPADGGGDPVFFVRDNGVGIEPADRDKVFSLFERLGGEGEGTGVGLALVKRIVEVHGGRIWVESDGRFLGSTFCFTLPSPIAGAGVAGEPR